MSAPSFPSPEITPETTAFWQACREGRLQLQRCTTCREVYHYPRPFCPFCMSDKIEQFDASGRGVIYSFTVFRRGAAPMAPAFVKLADGPIIKTAIVDADVEKIAIGLPVKLKFSPTESGTPLPVFTLA